MKGFTLIELLITLAVAAIGVALAVPSYQEFIRKRHTESRSEQFASFVNLAHAEAVKRFEPVTVNVAWEDERTWCAGAVLGNVACDCSGADADNLCAIDGADFTFSSQATFEDAARVKAVMVNPATTSDGAANGTTFTFDPTRGVMADDNDSLQNPHEFSFASDNGHFRAEITVLPTGRLSTCSSGPHWLTSFDPCR